MMPMLNEIPDADCTAGLRTRLVDAVSTPELLKMLESKMVRPEVLISHRAC